MATFVLVHGAWHGSWCWKRVRKALQAQGHDVFTPTLTGVAERSHLMSRDVNLETHILDVMNLIRWEELSDVALCGHSYGGCVISGVADRIPDRIRSLVYLDAFVLEDGENLAQHVPEAAFNQLLEGAKNAGEGWKVPPIPAEVFKVNAADLDWVNRQCTMHPIECFQQRIQLTGGVEKVKNVTFILATGFVEGSPFPPFLEKARAKGWKTLTIPCGHDVMLDRPEELTRVLLDAADAPSTDSSAARGTLQNLIQDYRRKALIYVAAKLRIADLLAEGPQSGDELARSIGAHAPTLHRILRGLVAVGVFSEEGDGRFRLAELGTCLQTEAPGSLRGGVILSTERSAPAWGGLLHTAMTGEIAFNHVFGMSLWEYQKQHPEHNEHFNQNMTRRTDEITAAVLTAYDFSPFRRIADVGGGQGTLLAAILKAYPAATGILFDQPHVVAGAGTVLKAAGVSARCQVVEGSFFEGLPDDADLHVLKNVIHDWDEEKSLAILRNCHRALKGSGKLLLVERILPPRVDQAPDMIWSDLHMMVMGGGQERTEAEYGTLFAASGFKLTRVVSTSSGYSLIEGIRV